MGRARRTEIATVSGKATWKVAQYTRLSREDGDKIESDSIANQKNLLNDYMTAHADMELAGLYVDDGYTGTNFNRPDFLRMIEHIERGKVNCVLVKDLSRFGRDYIDVGRYLERWFPEHEVRFIAVGDHIDSEKGPYDMLLPVKNVFNEQYARDISQKVKGAFQTKRNRGEFVGSFASFGYRKDAENKNRLVIDPYAARIIKRIFDLFEDGMGKVGIAKTLNAEGIPCPSVYKEQSGLNYNNGRRIQGTTYWTYATIHRILNNRIYVGDMVQGKSYRPVMHAKTKRQDRDKWSIVADTHEAVIEEDQWERVQSLLKKDTRAMNFEKNVGLFAGFLRCGDCGRAMSKTNHSGGAYYCCGSYKRYGPTVCTRHAISQRDLEHIVLEDINKIIGDVKDLKELAISAIPHKEFKNYTIERERCRVGLERLYRLKKSAYEDYREKLVNREDYLRYKEDYERQEQQLQIQLETLRDPEEEENVIQKPWVENLLKCGYLTELDRATLAETLDKIQIFEDGKIEITYMFSHDMEIRETKKEGAE